jgi:hypothetical protein
MKTVKPTHKQQIFFNQVTESGKHARFCHEGFRLYLAIKDHVWGLVYDTPMRVMVTVKRKEPA